MDPYAAYDPNLYYQHYQQAGWSTTTADGAPAEGAAANYYAQAANTEAGEGAAANPTGEGTATNYYAQATNTEAGEDAAANYYANMTQEEYAAAWAAYYQQYQYAYANQVPNPEAGESNTGAETTEANNGTTETNNSTHEEFKTTSIEENKEFEATKETIVISDDNTHTRDSEDDPKHNKSLNDSPKRETRRSSRKQDSKSESRKKKD